MLYSFSRSAAWKHVARIIYFCRYFQWWWYELEPRPKKLTARTTLHTWPEQICAGRWPSNSSVTLRPLLWSQQSCANFLCFWTDAQRRHQARGRQHLYAAELCFLPLPRSTCTNEDQANSSRLRKGYAVLLLWHCNIDMTRSTLQGLGDLNEMASPKCCLGKFNASCNSIHTEWGPWQSTGPYLGTSSIDSSGAMSVLRNDIPALTHSQSMMNKPGTAWMAFMLGQQELSKGVNYLYFKGGRRPGLYTQG